MRHRVVEQLPPIPVYMDGFKSDTLTLAHYGWEFFIQYQPEHLAELMVLRYKSRTGYARFEISQLVNYTVREDPRHMEYFRFNVDFDKLTAQEVMVDMSLTDSRTWYQIDMQEAHRPKMFQENYNNIGLKGFIQDIFPPKVEDSIWVPESARVDNLLDELLGLQVDKQKEIRTKRRKQERNIILLEDIA